MQSELTVITKAKDLCGYILTVTQKSPKNFRYTFVSRVQNLAMDIIENLYRANDVFVVRGDAVSCAERLSLQHKAMTNIKLLAYVSQLAMEHKCILPKQFEQISQQATECIRLLGAWINSDRKRLR